jgi:hydroxymethylpyrimidine pyrophosphatase-like HAD family hydrolase
MNEAVRAVADAVAPPVDEDGVASFIHGFFEGEGY